MVTSPALLILVVITAIAATVWLFSFRYLVNSPVVAARRVYDELDPAPVIPTFDASATRIVGAAEVEGDFRDNSRRLASVLARDGVLPASPVQILERSDQRITFRTAADANKPRGEIVLVGKGSHQTTLDYAVDYPALNTFLRAAWTLQAVSLIALAVGFWAVRTYVITSNNPAIKWQSIQMIQIVHLIWPPFMLGYRYRAGYKLVRTKLDMMLVNLPHTPV